MKPSFLLAGQARPASRPLSRAAWRATAVAALAPLAVLAVACSSSAPPAQPSATGTLPGTGSAGPGTVPVTGSPGPSTSAPTTSAPAGQQPQSCPTSSLKVQAGRGLGAAGSTYVPIVFTNISSVTCTLYGYPGVSLAGGSPVSQIGAAADENKATPRQVVTLGPAARAFAELRIVAAQNYPPARCHLVKATYLQVYPPNQTTPVYVAYRAAACVKPVHLLTVDVVKPGSGR